MISKKCDIQQQKTFISKLKNYQLILSLRQNNFFKITILKKKDKFDLCEQAISYCIVNNVKINEKFSNADIGLPWNILRIKK